MGGLISERRVGVLLLAILAAAALLRFASLSTIPPAQFGDIALAGLDALRALSGHPRLHYTYDEGLYSNLMALFFWLFGVSDSTLRAPGALYGVLTCWGVYRLGRALGLERAGLYGAALLAVSFWHLVLSRSGFRAILLPMLMVHAMALMVEGLRKPSAGRLAAAGALFGLGVHVYPAIRFAPFFLPFYLLAELGRDKEAWRRSLRGLVLFAAASVIVALPMLVHYVHHPEHLNFPHRKVSVFSPKLDPHEIPGHLKRNLPATLLMFHVHGDENWRHNYAGSPMLDPLTGILFLVGAVGVWFRRRAGPVAAPLLISWFVVMLLPNYLSVEGVPHGLRSCGTIPAIALLAGLGAVIAESWVSRRAGPKAAVAALVTSLVLLGGWTSYRYFVLWANDPRVAEKHDYAFKAAAQVLLAAPPGVERFVLANGSGYEVYGYPGEVSPFLWEMRDDPPILLGPHDSEKIILDGRPAMVAFVKKDDAALEVIRSLNPGAPIQAIEADGLSDKSPVYRIN